MNSGSKHAIYCAFSKSESCLICLFFLFLSKKYIENIKCASFISMCFIIAVKIGCSQIDPTV